MWKWLCVKCRCSFRKHFNPCWAYWIMELRTATVFTTSFAAVTLLIKTSSLLFFTIPRRTVGRKFFSFYRLNTCFSDFKVLQLGVDWTFVVNHQVFYFQLVCWFHFIYCKVANTNTSRLEAHPGFYRLRMKGNLIFIKSNL